jgi:hypothetical protein
VKAPLLFQGAGLASRIGTLAKAATAATAASAMSMSHIQV